MILIFDEEIQKLDQAQLMLRPNLQRSLVLASMESVKNRATMIKQRKLLVKLDLRGKLRKNNFLFT